MARTKNRGYQQTLAPTYTARLWKMGGYIRLSREDLQKINRGLDDSNSVKNQRDILNDFHHNHIDEFESYTEYVDDGHTGTDTERESFQRLLGDVMSGKINCVVVKDLSRFVRNYSDAGSVSSEIWPLKTSCSSCEAGLARFTVPAIAPPFRCTPVQMQIYSLEISLFPAFAPCLRGLRQTDSGSSFPL